MVKTLIIWLVIELVLMTVFNQFTTRQAAQAPMEYSQFLEEVKSGRISKVTIEGRQLKAQTVDGKRVTSYSPGDIWLVSDLLKYGVKVEAKPEEEPSLLMNIFVSWFPMLLLIGVWIFFMRQMQGGGRGGAFSFGKSRARMLDENQNQVTFADVAGVDEAKEEVRELGDFLRDPSKIQKLSGGLSSRAASGGLPRSRQTPPPSRHPRGARRPLFSHSRFPLLQVVVPLPDIRGRDQILLVHMRKVPIAPDVDASIIARGTPGFSGADLANLVNEAALFAARGSKRLVDMDDFERAKDKVIMGAERRSMVMPEEERKNTAYHEAGHAIVARLLPKTDPVHKVTIIPRGRALGVTMQLPVEDRYSYDRNYLLNNIAVLFGGRIAEELFMNQMTTGAANDFKRATEMARRMVTEWGMTDALGPMVYGENDGEVFLGRQVTTHQNMSEETMKAVDKEVRAIIDMQYALARRLLEENREKVEVMTKALLEWETIDAHQIGGILQGRPTRPPKPR